MKKLLVVSTIAALGLTSAVFAGGIPVDEMPAPVATSDAGIYLGVEGGYGLTNWKNIDGTLGSMTNVVTKDNGFVGRAFLGYDINKYFAVEFGYGYFFNKANVASTLANEINSTNIKTQVFDLFGKVKGPITEEFSLFAKLGMDYLISKDDTSTVKNFNVAYGAGADYAITPNVIANVEWLRYNGKAKITDPANFQEYADAFMIGLRYKFDL